MWFLGFGGGFGRGFRVGAAECSFERELVEHEELLDRAAVVLFAHPAMAAE